MYYEVTIIYTSGKVSIQNYEPHEIIDTRAYCQEGVRGGWIKSYNTKSQAEEY